MENVMQIDISISCRNLKNMDFLLDKSDPYVKVSMDNKQNGKF